RPKSMAPGPLVQVASASLPRKTLARVRMCRPRPLNRHRYGRPYTQYLGVYMRWRQRNRRTGPMPRSGAPRRPASVAISSTRTLRIEQHVVESPLGDQAVQHRLIQPVQAEPVPVGELPPPLGSKVRADHRLKGPHRPPEQARCELLGLRPDPAETGGFGPSLHLDRFERVKVDRELQVADEPV